MVRGCEVAGARPNKHGGMPSMLGLDTYWLPADPRPVQTPGQEGEPFGRRRGRVLGLCYQLGSDNISVVSAVNSLPADKN